MLGKNGHTGGADLQVVPHAFSRSEKFYTTVNTAFVEIQRTSDICANVAAYSVEYIIVSGDFVWENEHVLVVNRVRSNKLGHSEFVKTFRLEISYGY